MSENQKNIISELHQSCTHVYCGTRQLDIKEQRGRKYVNYKGKQVNIKDIPEVNDEEFDYVFNYGWRDYPNEELSEKIKNSIGHKKTIPNIFSSKKDKLNSVFVMLKNGTTKQFELMQNIDIKDFLKSQNIEFKYFKTVKIQQDESARK